MKPLRPARIPLAAALLAIACSGCDGQETKLAEDEPPAPPSPWRHGAVHVEQGDAELEAAMSKARETADDARERWLKTPQSLRTRWAVKWAAPTVDGAVEHLWVQPLHWSAFRVEGLLASEPVGRLAADEHRGDDDPPLRLGAMIAFPIEELADWVHYLSGDAAGPREGGYTIDVLETRYGRPP